MQERTAVPRDHERDIGGRAWDKLDREPEWPYQLFLAYLSYPAPREFKSAMTLVSWDGEERLQLANRYRRIYQWDRRVAQFDLFNNRLDLAQRIADPDIQERMWENIRSGYRFRAVNIGMRLLERASQMLEWPTSTEVLETDDAGRPMTVIKPAGWKMADIAKMVDTADKIVRLAAEMETSRTTVDMTMIRNEAAAIAQETNQDPDRIATRAMELAQRRDAQRRTG